MTAYSSFFEFIQTLLRTPCLSIQIAVVIPGLREFRLAHKSGTLHPPEINRGKIQRDQFV